MAWTNILPFAIETKASQYKIMARFSLTYLDNFFGSAGMRIYNTVTGDTLDFEASGTISPYGGLQFQPKGGGVNDFGTPMAPLTRLSTGIDEFDMIVVLSGAPWFSDFANLEMQADI